ncbi:wax ester/triacylglycerol synthase family O-acyltransferase [Amycolatopsis balhimycina DSM 5908]|uniref:Diacylglycerol O-acyltransferase n=1 Tax=Amycolatopsis balhimycina DSM 5908 TaxID=1081091 RepID=A0A428W4Q4_AMYBA|nr:wax ester/triacylglycerol synthase family O-acyltransferase [Amycolatopsis balhimycina]RSM38105.1 wax ester/triacylglycerol synthase family O-acyltransferase [Amycolatopsis balhimycina DSM 5908]
MDRLSPLDAAFLEIEDEDPSSSLAIASVAIAEGPAPGQDEFIAAVLARLAGIPRSRQKVRTVPFDLGPPAWVDDPAFDPPAHFGRVALPTPHDESALNDLVALLMSERLERDRPLWEFWVIEGLPDGRWAILTKVHHALADGLAATRLQTVLFGDAPADTRPVAAAADPGAAGLVLEAVGSLLSSPWHQARLVAREMLHPNRLARRVNDAARGLAAMTSALLPVSPTPLTGPLGRDRRYSTASVPLADVQTVARTFGVTVNDVLLAAVTGGFRELLLQRGETPAADSVRSLVPVSVRTGTALDNEVSLLLPLLPVELADPAQRLVRVHRRLGTLKAAKEADAGALLTATAAHEPFAPVAWAIRAAAHLPQRNIVTVTTNVRGPAEPMSALGRRIVRIHPYVPIALRVRIGVAMLSYAGEVTFGITADADTVPDTDVLAKAIERDFPALLAAAR